MFLWRTDENYPFIIVKYPPLSEPPHDKTNKVTVHPAKTQISLGIRPESSPCAQWVAKDPSFFHADREDSDQTGRIPRLICVFTGRTATLLVLSRGGSILLAVRLYNQQVLTNHKAILTSLSADKLRRNSYHS